jgi:virginiamycin B lyase
VLRAESRSRLRLVASLAVAFAFAGGVGSAGAAVTEFPIPTPQSRPTGIAAGSDGALWFTESSVSKIGRISTSGAITEYATPDPAGAITAGPDGALWYTTAANKIGRIDTSGATTEYPIPAGFDNVPWDITAGPDGALWYLKSNSVGRMATDGTVTEYPLANSPGARYGITAGPDGALWFTEFGANKIGRITTSGAITEYPVTGSTPRYITAGPDGALWFSDRASDGQPEFERMTTDGAVTGTYVWQAGGGGNPDHLTTGADGALWFLGFGQAIGRMTTAGAFTYDHITEDAFGVPTAITAGPNGTLWFTDYSHNKIGRVVPGDEVTFSAGGPDGGFGTPPGGGSGTPPGGSGGAAAALGAALGPVGPGSSITAILKAGGYLASLSAPKPGTAKVVWYLVPKGAHIAAKPKPIVVASGSKTLKQAGKAKLKVKLTSAGKALLKKAKTLKLTAKGSFKPQGNKATTATHVFKLKR